MTTAEIQPRKNIPKDLSSPGKRQLLSLYLQVTTSSEMPNAQFDVERATGGLVMALFVVAALLLAGLLYFVRQDIEARAESPEDAPQAVRFEQGPSTVGAVSIPVLRSVDASS